MGDEQYCLFLYANANERRKFNIILLKGELQLKISLLHMKVLTLIKAKVMFFFDTCNAVAAREDRKPKY